MDSENSMFESIHTEHQREWQRQHIIVLQLCFSDRASAVTLGVMLEDRFQTDSKVYIRTLMTCSV